MAIGGTSPSSFLFLLGRAHVTLMSLEHPLPQWLTRTRGFERACSGLKFWELGL